ncbi:metalloprotease [Colletotrichum incanum]|uniref:Metalloprotease n=1 Tax=Colletotrichum incanum TaxID=1573173 RepID=A0A161Y2I2_COLIC|nr:metalloprotease [Colletotrichum incanum]
MRFFQLFDIFLLVFIITTGASFFNEQVIILPRCGNEVADKRFTRDNIYSGQRGSLEGLDVTVHLHTASSTDRVNAITDDASRAQFEFLQTMFAEHDINLHWNGIVASQTVDDWLAQFTWPIKSDRVAQKKQFLTSTRLGGYDELNF